MSKYYGESERLLGAVFSQANELSDGAILFLDEIDGFEPEKKVVVIAATNREQDLDSALIRSAVKPLDWSNLLLQHRDPRFYMYGRFDSTIMFGLPDLQTRQEIIAQYAKQLSKPELVQLAQATKSMSDRDIRDVCQGAERAWASKLIRRAKASGEQQITLPPMQEYLESAGARRKALLSVKEQREQNMAGRFRKHLLDFE